MRLYYLAGSLLQRIAWPVCRVLFLLFFRAEIRGLENVREIKSNSILAANHANELDPLIIISSLPFFSRFLPMIFVSRDKTFYKKLGWRGALYGGTFFKLMAAFEAYTGLKDYEKALPHHLEALRSGRSVCIFPMGKKHLDEDIHKAKGGVAYLAAATGIPIIPVRITGVDYLKPGEFWRRQRKLRVTFGTPVSFTDLTNNTTNPDHRVCEEAAVALMERVVALDSSDRDS